MSFHFHPYAASGKLREVLIGGPDVNLDDEAISGRKFSKLQKGMIRGIFCSMRSFPFFVFQFFPIFLLFRCYYAAFKALWTLVRYADC